jgi:hypothetical protein
MARRRIFLEDLEAHHCRYVTTENHPHRFCGKQRLDKSSYCPEHTALCWKGVPDRFYFMWKKDEKEAA